MINAEDWFRGLAAHIQQEMIKAAEPLIEAALDEARKHMRKRVAEIAVGVIDHSYAMDRHGADLRIIVNLRKPGT